jgi:hypothetical protein
VSEDTVFAADGAPPPPAVRARLGSFCFYRDVINKLGRRQTRRDRPAELDDTVFRGDVDDSRFINSMDSWFRDALGGEVRFTGNEGSGEETEYACYVLVVGRRGPAGAKEQPDSESGRATGRTEWTGRTGRTELGQPPIHKRSETPEDLDAVTHQHGANELLLIVNHGRNTVEQLRHGHLYMINTDRFQ